MLLSPISWCIWWYQLPTKRLQNKCKPHGNSSCASTLVSLCGDKFKTELDSLIDQGRVTPVSKPTAWVNSVPQKLETWTIHFMPPLHDSIFWGHHNKASWDKIVDGNSGYWQMKLDKKSKQLVTFITPLGRCEKCPRWIPVCHTWELWKPKKCTLHLWYNHLLLWRLEWPWHCSQQTTPAS